MAIDETLLESAATENRCTLRWYQWDQPTISLGYFQKNVTEDADETWKNLARVRRLSGGGAILHHHELTYSFALPGSHSLAKSPPELYVAIHQFSFAASHFGRSQSHFSASDEAMNEI